jgi:nitrogen-specific signal transduction histidine kinase
VATTHPRPQQPSLTELAEALAQTILQSVTVVKGAADLLDGRWADLDDDGRVELAHMLRRHADHLADLVDDFRAHPDLFTEIDLRDRRG